MWRDLSNSSKCMQIALSRSDFQQLKSPSFAWDLAFGKEELCTIKKREVSKDGHHLIVNMAPQCEFHHMHD